MQLYSIIKVGSKQKRYYFSVYIGGACMYTYNIISKNARAKSNITFDVCMTPLNILYQWLQNF